MSNETPATTKIKASKKSHSGKTEAGSQQPTPDNAAKHPKTEVQASGVEKDRKKEIEETTSEDTSASAERATFDLRQALAESGYDKAGIDRIEAARMRLRIPSNDPALGMLVELEGYIKLFEEIPSTIERAHQSAAAQAKQQSQRTLNELTFEMTRQWMKSSDEMVQQAVQLKKLSMLVWCCVVLFTVSATSMALYALLNSQLPHYITDSSITGFVPLDWFLGSLNVPLWWILLAIFTSLIVIKAIERATGAAFNRDDASC